MYLQILNTQNHILSKISSSVFIFTAFLTLCISASIFLIIIHQIFSLSRDWSKRVTWPKYSPAKTGEYPRIFPNFQNCVRCEKDLKDDKDNSLHLGRKYARIFVLGHYLFLVAHSFPRASLSENCSLLGKNNVRGQISELIIWRRMCFTGN